MKRKIFIVLFLTALCGIYSYLSVKAEEKSETGQITSVENTLSNAIGPVGTSDTYSNDLAAYTLPGPMGPTTIIGCGICATNLTTSVENCCFGRDMCFEDCTLAVACRGDIIEFQHVLNTPPTGPPFDLWNCLSDNFWMIYTECFYGNGPGPLYQTFINPALTTFTLNTATMPPGTYWIGTKCDDENYCRTGFFPFIIQDCDSSDEGCDRCDCGLEMWVSDYNIDQYGYAFVTLEFPPVGPASLAAVNKLRISIANYHSEADDECKKCDIPEQEMFGDIIYAPALYSVSPEYTSYAPPASVSFSREVTWCFDPPITPFEPGSVLMAFRFPPVKDLECCRNDASFCLRIEFWDHDCKQCEQLLCLDWDLAGMAPGSEVNKTHLKVKPTLKTGNIETIPNPAHGNFDMKISKDDLPGFALIYDANGSMVDRINVNSEATSVNSKNWKQGIYFIKYISKTASYTSKIVIDRK